jgi:hypothetical protein
MNCLNFGAFGICAVAGVGFQAHGGPGPDVTEGPAMTSRESLEYFEAGAKAARRRGVDAECPADLTGEPLVWWRRGNAMARAGGPRLYQMLRQLRLAAAQSLGTHTWAEWDELKARHGGRCAICGSIPKRLHRDHILAIAAGGSDMIDNIQPACPRCNSVKGVKPAAPAVPPRIRRVPRSVRSRPDFAQVSLCADEVEPNLYYRRGVPFAKFVVHGVQVSISLTGYAQNSPSYDRSKTRSLRAWLRRAPTPTLDELKARLALQYMMY